MLVFKTWINFKKYTNPFFIHVLKVKLKQNSSIINIFPSLHFFSIIDPLSQTKTIPKGFASHLLVVANDLQKEHLFLKPNGSWVVPTFTFLYFIFYNYFHSVWPPFWGHSNSLCVLFDCHSRLELLIFESTGRLINNNTYLKAVIVWKSTRKYLFSNHLYT